MSETAAPADTLPADAAGFFLLRHFLIDLSVENPFGRLPDEAATDLQLAQHVATGAVPLAQAGDHGVNIFLRLTASAGGRAVFLAELNYRADVRLQNVAAEDAARVLEVEVPEALSPLLREILERNGTYCGYPEMRLAGLGFEEAFARRTKADATH